MLDNELGEIIRVYRVDRPRVLRKRVPFLIIGAAIIGWAIYLFWQGASAPSPFARTVFITHLLFTLAGTSMIAWGWRRGVRPNFAWGGIEEFSERIPSMGLGFIVAGIIQFLFVLDARYCVLGIGIVTACLAALSLTRWGGPDAQATVFRDGFNYSHGDHTVVFPWTVIKHVSTRGNKERATLTITQHDGRQLYFRDTNLEDYASLVETIMQHTQRSRL
jgi:hypothetical protein